MKRRKKKKMKNILPVDPQKRKASIIIFTIVLLVVFAAAFTLLSPKTSPGDKSPQQQAYEDKLAGLPALKRLPYKDSAIRLDEFGQEGDKYLILVRHTGYEEDALEAYKKFLSESGDSTDNYVVELQKVDTLPEIEEEGSEEL